MRKVVTLAAVFATALTGVPADVFAQARVIPAALSQPAAADVSFSSLFSAYPKGGAELSGRIADLVVSNPDVAVALANFIKTDSGLNDAQKQAARQGIAEALVRLNVYAQQGGPVFTPQTLAILAGLAGAGILIAVIAKNNKSNASPN